MQDNTPRGTSRIVEDSKSIEDIEDISTIAWRCQSQEGLQKINESL
jgi:hypothetical protein